MKMKNIAIDERNELMLLAYIKNQLIDKGDLSASTSGFYTLQITDSDWHKIFKTDKYNKLKETPNGRT